MHETEVDQRRDAEDQQARPGGVKIERVVVGVLAREEAEALPGVGNGRKGAVESFEPQVTEPVVKERRVMVDGRLGERPGVAGSELDAARRSNPADPEVEHGVTGDGAGAVRTARSGCWAA